MFHDETKKVNLAEDATELRFRAEDLAGCSADWIAERTDSDGDVIVNLKYV